MIRVNLPDKDIKQLSRHSENSITTAQKVMIFIQMETPLFDLTNATTANLTSNHYMKLKQSMISFEVHAVTEDGQQTLIERLGEKANSGNADRQMENGLTNHMI